jgi:hypothetical protein
MLKVELIKEDLAYLIEKVVVYGGYEDVPASTPVVVTGDNEEEEEILGVSTALFVPVILIAFWILFVAIFCMRRSLKKRKQMILRTERQPDADDFDFDDDGNDTTPAVGVTNPIHNGPVPHMGSKTGAGAGAGAGSKSQKKRSNSPVNKVAPMSTVRNKPINPLSLAATEQAAVGSPMTTAEMTESLTKDNFNEMDDAELQSQMNKMIWQEAGKKVVNVNRMTASLDK